MVLSRQSRTIAEYTIIAATIVLVMQTLVILIHEFTHSTMAWLLGHMHSPFDIVWGNPLTMSGWDEGVAYQELFASGHLLAAALIGVCPLGVHAAIVCAGITVMQKGRPENKWWFHLLYWFVVVNFMELIAYILMRSFSTSGDVGIFNRGLKLSPWVVFAIGSLAILYGLYVFYGRIISRMFELFAQGNRPLKWTILAITSFVLFLWGSGLRVLFFVYPDPQWMFGLLGVFAFALVMAVYKPIKK